ncbi:hypothetical protein CspHIS471_0309520 [Cutaneotrichosporon sp. HIS471]|nr:hypothetical protein CspHIS471_0309520 [Cutaneotrichosporon sp. HIS471]
MPLPTPPLAIPNTSKADCQYTKLSYEALKLLEAQHRSEKEKGRLPEYRAEKEVTDHNLDAAKIQKRLSKNASDTLEVMDAVLGENETLKIENTVLKKQNIVLAETNKDLEVENHSLRKELRGYGAALPFMRHKAKEIKEMIDVVERGRRSK